MNEFMLVCRDILGGLTKAIITLLSGIVAIFVVAVLPWGLVLALVVGLSPLTWSDLADLVTGSIQLIDSPPMKILGGSALSLALVYALRRREHTYVIV